jgi:putative nucleotidyltransferase with HDIG domain
MKEEAYYRNIVDKTDELPTLSAVIGKINEATASPTTSASEVAGIIQEDQALSTNVLKLVNSSFYGFPKQINSISRAIVILGFQKVRSLAMTTSTISAFKGKNIGIDMNLFWGHCLGTAICAEATAKHFGLRETDDAFIAGLLHDVGKLVTAICFKEEAMKIYTLINEKNMWIRDAEAEVMEIDHAKIGFWLMKKWNLPENILSVVRFHHKPTLSRQSAPLVHVVHVADALCRSLGVGSGGDNLVPEISTEIWRKLALSDKVIDKLLDDTLEGLSRAEAFFDLIKSETATA